MDGTHGGSWSTAAANASGARCCRTASPTEPVSGTDCRRQGTAAASAPRAAGSASAPGAAASAPGAAAASSR